MNDDDFEIFDDDDDTCNHGIGFDECCEACEDEYRDLDLDDDDFDD